MKFNIDDALHSMLEGMQPTGKTKWNTNELSKLLMSKKTRLENLWSLSVNKKISKPEIVTRLSLEHKLMTIDLGKIKGISGTHAHRSAKTAIEIFVDKSSIIDLGLGDDWLGKNMAADVGIGDEWLKKDHDIDIEPNDWLSKDMDTGEEDIDIDTKDWLPPGDIDINDEDWS